MIILEGSELFIKAFVSDSTRFTRAESPIAPPPTPSEILLPFMSFVLSALTVTEPDSEILVFSIEAVFLFAAMFEIAAALRLQSTLLLKLRRQMF